MAKAITLLAVLGWISGLTSPWTWARQEGAHASQTLTSQAWPASGYSSTQPGTSSAPLSSATCRALIQKITPGSEHWARILQVLEQNIHWQGAPHQIFPKRIAVQKDIDAAFEAMDMEDLPILVHLIGTGKLTGGKLGLASGVLARFGPRALPCIDAGLHLYQTARASDLSATKINIQTAAEAAQIKHQ